MTVGEKIKYYRERKHMSQEELSLKSGISISAIRKYEKGLRFPKEAQIEKMALAFNISPVLLQDIKFHSSYDSLPYLYAILKDGNVEFCGEKDENGYLKEDSLSIKFHNNILTWFLKAWADKDTEIQQILNASTDLLDTEAQENILKRAEQLDSEIYPSLVASSLEWNHYREIEALEPDLHKIEWGLYPQSIRTYYDFLDVLTDLIFNINIDLYPDSYRPWDPATTIDILLHELHFIRDNGITSNLFHILCVYCNQLKDLGIRADIYDYTINDVFHTRVDIHDRIITEAASVIKGMRMNPLCELHAQKKEDYKKMLKEKLAKYKIPIQKQDS